MSRQEAPRTIKELKAAKEREKTKIEAAALPDKSMFGTDNRAIEKMLMDTFDKLIAGENPIDLEDKLYDMADISSAMYDTVSPAISLCNWAAGWEDKDFEAKED